jgi:hypothetical protein
MLQLSCLIPLKDHQNVEFAIPQHQEPASGYEMTLLIIFYPKAITSLKREREREREIFNR